MQPRHFSLRNHWCSRGLALLLVLILGIGLARPALAAFISIVDQSSCEAFGGSWGTSPRNCQKATPTTIAAGDTLVIQVATTLGAVTNNGSVDLEDATRVDGMFTNNAGATIAGGREPLTLGGGFTNAGVMNLAGITTIELLATNQSTGQINLRSGTTLYLGGGLTNQGTILINCGARIVNSGGDITGNPPQDLCPPNVRINQATDQADPTNRNPLRFTATFNEAVTDFTAADVTLGGTANRSGASVTVSGGPSSYTVSISGITGNGTVTAAVPANGATDGAGNGNTAATSTDNTVTYFADFTPPVAAPSLSPSANANGWHNRDVQVAWNWSDPPTAAGQGSGLDLATCPPAAQVTSEGRTMLDQRCFDRVGNEGRATAMVQLDKTPPTANPSQFPVANVNGWNNSDVTVTWNWRDLAPGTGQAAGLDPANCPLTLTSSGEGSRTLNSTCSDLADNRTPQNYTVLVDKIAPVVTVTGVSNGAVYTLGSVPTAGCNTTDSRAGVATQASLSLTSGNGNGTGSFTATCNDGTDLAGNRAAAVSVTYTVNALPTATPTATSTPTPTNTSEPTATSTNTPEPTATPTNTSEPTATPTNTPEPTATPTNTPEPTATPTNTPEPTATPGGTLISRCGPYTVYQNGTTYSADGWAGAILVGTNGNNTLTGCSSADLILGLGGNDWLKGNGGNDVLCGGDGVDLLQGQGGNDRLDGGNGSDVLNGGSGDDDELLGGEGNDVLLDGDGVLTAAGGMGNDLFTLALRNGWRDGGGQARFGGLSGGYGNDTVGLAILNSVSFLVDITGDERDHPASPLEGPNDTLALAGVIDPSSTLLKFEQQVVLSATNEAIIPGEESGAEYLTEPVGEASATPTALRIQLFLPLVNR